MALTIVALLVGIILGSLVVYILYRNKQTKIEQINYERKLKAEKEIAIVEERLSLLRQQTDHTMADYYQSEMEKMNLRLEADKITFTQQKEEYACKLQELQDSFNKEYESIKEGQQALIEVYKKQEEIRIQKDFYRLILSDEDMADIIELRALAPRLSHPDLLYKLLWSTYYKPAYDEMVGRVIGSAAYCGIYKITSTIDGKAYIGQSTNVKNRWSEHIKSALEIGTIAKSQLYSAMKKDGIHNFTFELVEECSKADLNNREKYYITFFETNAYGLNMTKGGS